MSNKKPIVSVDFDGVLNSYISGWQGARNIPDPPVPGAIEWLVKLVRSRKVKVAIFSSRSHQWGGRRAMRMWLMQHIRDYFLRLAQLGRADQIGAVGVSTLSAADLHDQLTTRALDLIEDIDFPLFKPPALITIDDRAVRFEGVFPSLDAILKFKPWKVQQGVMRGPYVEGYSTPGPKNPPRGAFNEVG